MLKIMYQLLKPVAYNKTKTKNKKIIKKKTTIKLPPTEQKKTPTIPHQNNNQNPNKQRNETTMPENSHG